MNEKDQAVAKRLIGTKGTIWGNHPLKGETGEIVRVEETLFGVRPVVRVDNMDGHEVFVMHGSEWRSNPVQVENTKED